ncbi:MAG: prenyltransferase/squalene oxidase repeat-containing protein, partial [Pirellulaceae bacterium]|nr:prenyltransferase/squalene oxidase repeat-containing protein [Pirellulaceae bacterium]
MTDALPLLIAGIFGGQVLRWIVWSGLVAATVGLLVLMRTQWGGSQPLRKCIVLSLLVHLLFGIYTTTVNIVVASIGKGPGTAPTWVEISSEGGTDEVSHEGVEDAIQGTPWGRFADGPTAIDTPIESPRLREDLLDRHMPSSLPKVDDRLLEKITSRSIEHDGGLEAPSPEYPRVARETPASKAAAIEAPKASKTDTTGTNSTEKVAAPDRFAADRTANAPLVGPPDLPTAPFDSIADMLPPRHTGNDVSPPGTPGEERISTRPAGAGASSSSDELSGPLVPIARGATGGTGGTGSAEAVPAILKGRVGADRLQRAIANGGSQETEAAVVAALEWLARNQHADGRWDADQHEAGREVMVNGHNRSGAGTNADSGITGLALLSMLAHGNTHLKGEHPKTVQRGLEWLLAIQGADGNLGGDATVYERMYCHAMATCALSEAYAMSRDERLAAPVKQAVNYSLRAQDRNGGGWRYRPGDSGDTSQLGWQVMALKSAELAGIEIPTETRAGMVKFLKSVASGKSGGLASYRPGHRVTHTMTAEALVCRQFLGMPRENPAANEAGNFVITELPGEGDDNVYYWYYGTLGMFQLQGNHWKQWNEALQTKLLGSQQTTGKLRGSWDPDGTWGAYGGRVYSTARSAHGLDVYTRCLQRSGDAARRDRRA